MTETETETETVIEPSRTADGTKRPIRPVAQSVGARRSSWHWIAMMVVGSAAALLCAGLGAIVVLLALLAGEMIAPSTILVAGSVIALGVGLGGPVAYYGWSGWLGRSSRLYRPPAQSWLWAVLALALGAGAVLGQRDATPSSLLLPVHVATMAAPPLLLLALAGRSLRGTEASWRSITAALGGGGLVGVLLALVAEAALAAGLGLVVVALLLVIPGGMEGISSLTAGLQEYALSGNSQVINDLILQPLVLASLVGMVGIAAPLIEEALKTLAIGIASARLRPSPARAFLWGVASGAGFAIAENLLNGAVLGGEGWTGVALSRMAATVMHAFTGGLMGWGWSQLWVTGRGRRFAAALAGSAALHGLWNLTALAPSILSAVASRQENQALWMTISSAGQVAAVTVLGVLAVACALALPVIGRRLADAQRPTAKFACEPRSPAERVAPPREWETPGD